MGWNKPVQKKKKNPSTLAISKAFSFAYWNELSGIL